MWVKSVWGTELSLSRSYAAGGGRDEYGVECSSVLCSVFSSGLRMPACRRVTCMWQMPATRTAECNSGHTLQCRASVSIPSGWKCNACAAADPSTSTRQAITSQGGIQRAMLPCLCFIAIKLLYGLPDLYLFWLWLFLAHLEEKRLHNGHHYQHRAKCAYDGGSRGRIKIH